MCPEKVCARYFADRGRLNDYDEIRTGKTDFVLFIAAGAFHIAKPSDLIPELQGRFPIRVELSDLSLDDFVSILTEPKNALTKQYVNLSYRGS